MQKVALRHKSQGHRIAVVPTMGYLHEGHLSLLRKARQKSDILILTLFVNPTQFGPKEDLSRYPRDTKGDLAKAKKMGVDYVFLPDSSDMYPDGYETYVNVLRATETLCGASRPGHFQGVTTVVAKLFNITQAHTAFFGMKDFQQCSVIKKMVLDLNMPIKIVAVPTVREKDGLAMSSRNVYLDAQQRQAALCLNRSLQEVKMLHKKIHQNIDMFLRHIEKIISQEKLAKIDYVSCVDATTMQPLKTYCPGNTLFALAVYFGKTRLIDNLVI